LVGYPIWHIKGRGKEKSSWIRMATPEGHRHQHVGQLISENETACKFGSVRKEDRLRKKEYIYPVFSLEYVEVMRHE
jgi:hypothetical protein